MTKAESRALFVAKTVIQEIDSLDVADILDTVDDRLINLVLRTLQDVEVSL